MQWVHRTSPSPEWEKFYAWKPTPIGAYPIEDGKTVVWFQWIERKWVDGTYNHRLIKEEEPKIAGVKIDIYI